MTPAAAALLWAFLAQAPIDARAYRADVEFLASDALQGRRAGAWGHAAAARYLAAQMQQIGLEPMGDLEGAPRTYLQRFDFGLRDLGPSELAIESGSLTLTPACPGEWIPLVGSFGGRAEGPAVFAGFGITAPECCWDDYASIDARGKVVVVLRHEPFALDEMANDWNGTSLTRHAALAVKAANAAAHGAVAMAVVPGVAQFPEGRRARSVPGRRFWKSLNPIAVGAAQLGRMLPEDDLAAHNATPAETADQVLWTTQAPLHAVRLPVPSFYLTAGTAEALFPIEAWEREILTARGPRSRDLENVRIRVKIETVAETMPCQNVVGLLRGADPELSRQVVVVGGHFDHVGMNAAGEVWNGADDNASGAAAVLAIARTLAKAPPKRSVLFVHFGAEEVALLGSFHFVEHPPVPLGNVIAMLNCDMIARGSDEDLRAKPGMATGKDEVAVAGVLSSPVWDPILVKSNRGLSLTVVPSETYFDRSDQAAFYFKGVPVLFFTTGEHGDYHRATDEAPRLDFDKAVRVATLASRCAVAVANLAAPPPFLDVLERNTTVAGSSVKGWILGRTGFLERADY